MRDVPSLVTKTKRLVSVWQTRQILSELQVAEVTRTINSAIDDYHHKIDRRTLNQPSLEGDEDVKNGMDGMDGDGQSREEDGERNRELYESDENDYRENPAFSETQSVVSSIGDSFDHDELGSAFPDNDLREVESFEDSRQALISNLEKKAQEEERQFMEVNRSREMISQFPSWVTSTPDFLAMEHQLRGDQEQTSCVLYRAMGPVMAIETQLNGLIAKRKEMMEMVEDIRKWKRRRQEEVQKVIDVGLNEMID